MPLLTPDEQLAAATQRAELSTLVKMRDPRALKKIGLVLAAHGGDCDAAGRALGVSRQTMYRWRREWPALQEVTVMTRKATP